MRLLIPLFSPPTGTWGSLTRVLAVAQAAREAGHAVAFTAAGVLADKLRSQGHRVYDIPASTFLGLPKPISDLIAQRSQRTSLPVRSGKSFGSIWLVLLVSGAAGASYLRSVVEAELRAVRAFKPDAIFTELDPGAFVVAQVTGLPIATTYATIMEEGEHTFAWRLLSRSLGRVLEHFGCPPRNPHELCFAPQVLRIIPSVPELEDAGDPRDKVIYTGSLLAPIEDSGEELVLDPARKNIFAYLGTGSISLATLEEVLPRLLPAGSDTRCFVGAQSVKTPYVRGSVELSAYVPAHLLLPHCQFTITHGGHNTIIQSILNGVPLIIFPGPIFERRYNARKAAAAGCAVMGEKEDFNVQWLRSALARQTELAAGAAALAERIKSFGGAGAAVKALEDLAS